MNYLNRNKPLARRGSAAKIEARRLANFGTRARHAWWYTLACVCKGLHPACTGGGSDPSHTRSKGVRGDASTIIPMSRGCHDYIGARGWEPWERAVAEILGMDAPHVVEDDLGYKLDRHALAAELATRGPDAPPVAS